LNGIDAKPRDDGRSTNLIDKRAAISYNLDDALLAQ